MPHSRTVMGTEFEYSGTLAAGITVFFTPPHKKKITPEIIQVIRDEIMRRSPVLMGANRSPLVPDSIGQTLALNYRESPQVMSYVLPLLIEEGFCIVSARRPYVIYRKRGSQMTPARRALQMNDLLCRLKRKERRGSKARCHLLTHGDDAEVAARLTAMVAPWAEIRPDHVWLPRGFEDLNEARLGRTPGLLSYGFGKQVEQWWLEVIPGANTPNWDIASTCEIHGRDGLILVEAKAHWSELSCAGKPKPTTANGCKNHERIGVAIQEANVALNGILSGWGLSRDSHYQLSNRFAWAWKVASLGVPVLLVYLGFPNANEMCDVGKPFDSAADWEGAVRTHSAATVPDQVWGGNPLDIDGTPLKALIRSEQIALPPQGSPQSTS